MKLITIISIAITGYFVIDFLLFFLATRRISILGIFISLAVFFFVQITWETLAFLKISKDLDIALKFTLNSIACIAIGAGSVFLFWADSLESKLQNKDR